MNVPPNGQSLDDGLLKRLDHLIGPEPKDDQLDVRDSSTWDQRTSPNVSPIDGVMQLPPRSSASSPVPPSPYFPLPIPTLTPRSKKKSVVSKAWNKLKKMFMKKFERGDRAPPNLSDKLVPEREDEHKWSDTLFSKPTQSTITRVGT